MSANVSLSSPQNRRPEEVLHPENSVHNVCAALVQQGQSNTSDLLSFLFSLLLPLLWVCICCQLSDWCAPKLLRSMLGNLRRVGWGSGGEGSNGGEEGDTHRGRAPIAVEGASVVQGLRGPTITWLAGRLRLPLRTLTQ